jgi:hypothetical protein
MDGYSCDEKIVSAAARECKLGFSDTEYGLGAAHIPSVQKAKHLISVSDNTAGERKC